MRLFQNRFEKIKYLIKGYDIGVHSEGNNFSLQKIQIAIKQALSVWTAYSPLIFEEVFDDTYDISIEFFNYGDTTGDVGTTEFGNTIKINTTNRHFIDKENEPAYIPPELRGSSAYDLIGILAHEIGHTLGIDHPPLIDNVESPPGALMGRSTSGVRRQLNQYDIEQVQNLHGAIKISGKVSTDLAQCSQINASGLNFIKNYTSFIQVDGPVGTFFSIYIYMPNTMNRKVNALDFKYRTHLANTFVNSVELFDGIIPIQSYYLNCSINKTSETPFKDWNIKLGLISRPVIKHGVFAKVNIEFRNIDESWDVGIIQINEVTADCFFEDVFTLPNIGMITESIFIEKQRENDADKRKERATIHINQS